MGLESHIWGLPGSSPHVLPRVSAILKEANFCPAEIYWNGGGIHDTLIMSAIRLYKPRFLKNHLSHYIL